MESTTVSRDTGQAMSKENVETMWRLADAVNRHDADAFVALCAPNVDWEENTSVYPGLRSHYRGTAEVREWFEQAFLEFWADFHVEVQEITAAPAGRCFGDLFLVGRGRSSGIETRLRVYQVLWFEEGKVTRRQLFLDRAEALDSAGLSE